MKFNSVLMLLCIVGIWLLASCKKHTPDNHTTILVEVYTVRVDSTPIKRSYTGVVEEAVTSLLSFQVPGKIESIYVKENQMVQKGQPLAILNKQILQDSYDASAAVLNQAEDAYKRMKQLYENHSLPEIKWIEAQTSLQQAKAMESIAKENLQNGILNAPFGGIITNRIAETGMNVSAGMPVLRISDPDSIKIKVAVPEKEIAKTSIAQKCEIKVSVLSNKETFPGKIIEKGIIANPLSHTYEIKLVPHKKIEGLLPGMICQVNVVEDSICPQIIIPATAVQVDGTSSFVWSVKNDIVTRLSVKVGMLHKDGVTIEHGLKEGDRIIYKGYQKVSNGMKVQTR